MSSRRPPWLVLRDPAKIRYAFFISHVAEDAKVVRRLKKEIGIHSSRGGRTALDCFLDVEDWQIANDPMPVIRENLLVSDFTVLWITPSYLKNRRGWIWVELAYADLLERSVNFAGRRFDEFPSIVPVFRGVALAQIHRTPLVPYWQRRLFPPEKRVSVNKMAETLVDFYDQEMKKRRRADEE